MTRVAFAESTPETQVALNRALHWHSAVPPAMTSMPTYSMRSYVD
uniref:Uncharacterized protein n=1 Tax=Fusarium oxysporum (strain Fo5176) TaxID=660025 RepID=A0A0D2XQL2_FUSOF